MSQPLVDRIPFAKIMTVLAIGLGIGFGLCGVGMVASDGGNRAGFFGQLFTVMFEVGIFAFWLSALGLILSLAGFIVLSMVKEAKPTKKRSQRASTDGDDRDEPS